MMGFYPALRDGSDEETCCGLVEMLLLELWAGATWGWASVRSDFVYGAWSRPSIVRFALSLGPLRPIVMVKSAGFLTLKL